ncbi:hypothetical protein CR513_20700, partial [Mucuna pruriens]
MVNRIVSQLLRCFVEKNLKTWEAWLPYIEFAYNKVVNKTTSHTPFELVYGLKLLSPSDLVPLLVASKANPEDFPNQWLGYMRKLEHSSKGRVRDMLKGRIGTKNEDYLQKMTLFPTLRKSKLLPQGDKPFLVLKRINDNSYVLDMPQEYGGNNTFNVFDLSLFDVEEESNTNQGSHEESKKDIVYRNDLQGPLTRGRLKRLEVDIQKTMNLLRGKWSPKARHIFVYDEITKVRLVTYEFRGYALVWWNQYIREINTWQDIRTELRTRFVFASYARDLYNKFQRMYQGSKSVEEYFKEIEVALVRANVLESHEATMARFLHGLNRESCLASKRSYPSSSSWKGKEKKRERPTKDKSPKKKSVLSHGQKVEATPPNLSSYRSSRIKCFKSLGKRNIASQFPNKRTMVLRDDGNVESESSYEGSSSFSEVESSSVSSRCNGDLLMVRRLVSSLLSEDSDF